MNYIVRVVQPEVPLSMGPFGFNPRVIRVTLLTGAYSLLTCYLRGQVLWSFVLINIGNINSYVEFISVAFEEADRLCFTNLGDGCVSIWIRS